MQLHSATVITSDQPFDDDNNNSNIRLILKLTEHHIITIWYDRKLLQKSNLTVRQPHMSPDVHAMLVIISTAFLSA